MTKQLMAGVGIADITPPPGIPQGGWGAQLHQRSQGNDMPLLVRALALQYEGIQCVLVDIDAIGFDQFTTQSFIKAIGSLTGVPYDGIRVSCTHTHSGPNTFRLGMITEGLEMVRSYLTSLPEQIAGAAWQALQRLEPVRMAADTGNCGINSNRRCRDSAGRTFVGCNEAAAPVDRTVSVLRFDRLDKTPLAIVMHYACHPTIMGWQNQFITPDYPGQAKKVVEESLKAPCLFLQGCAGDVGPKRGFTGDLNAYRKSGTILGLEAAKIAWSIDTAPAISELQNIQESGARIGVYKEVPLQKEPQHLAVRIAEAAIPLKKQPEPEQMRTTAKALLHEVEQLKKRGGEQALRDARARATQASMAAERAELYAGKSSIPWPVQGIAIGDIALLGIAGEPFSAIGQAIQKRSPFRHTLVSGYSNGGFGYIPTREAFPEGGYEIETTPFSEDAADVVIAAGTELLDALWRHKNENYQN